ncbi:MAG: PfkB family carbohydrate kinase [Planctomycetota bacterium]|nr:PfkB family carbohydrate kinase [Planctomycetota bacterium]MDG1985064.1 PfkB family carbohydrate kinase [Planctomycetota bacterium]
MSLAVIGTLAYDSVETAHDSRENALGGSAMYCAVAAAPHFKPRLVGVVGGDFKAEHVELLRKRGICMEGLETVEEGKTFRWGGRYEPDWNTRHTTYTDLNVLEHFDPKLPEAYRDSRFVFLANAHPAVQLKALEQVEAPAFSVADTMNLWIDVARPDLDALMQRVDALILNDEEARMLTGENNLIRAAQRVLELGPKVVILKKGEHGAFIMGEGLHFSLPAYPVTEVVDPTGAGDCFAGGFMGHIASVGDAAPETLKRAMLHGTVAASFCVEGFSVETIANRTSADYDERYADLQAIVTL